MRFLYLLISLLTSRLIAHEPNAAYFSIIPLNGIIEIKADLPWTIRDALFAFNPELKDVKDKSAIEKSFLQYVKANLILKNREGKAMELVDYELLEIMDMVTKIVCYFILKERK